MTALNSAARKAVLADVRAGFPALERETTLDAWMRRAKRAKKALRVRTYPDGRTRFWLVEPR